MERTGGRPWSSLSSRTSLSFQYFKEFFSRCVTCPVYHQWVSELKASVIRYGKRESTSLTNIIRPFDTFLTRIWIEGDFLEENNSFGETLGKQSKHSFLEPLSERRYSLGFLQAVKGCSKVRRDTWLYGVSPCSTGNYPLISAGPSPDRGVPYIVKSYESPSQPFISASVTLRH